LNFDYIVVDPTCSGVGLAEAVSTQGGELILAELRDEKEKIHHSFEKLTSLFAHIEKKILIG